jgi:murein DD-endopeptidase MepM/ murein hydrolase activator NlpD
MKRKNRKESASEYGLEDIFIKYISSGKTMGRDITRDLGGGSLNEIIANNLSGKIVSVATNVITKAPEFIVKGLQKGGSPFVPGSGDGDRVPALLEPGEFVVNKKAAKKYGGLLHDINFNQAPRFQSGGMPGMKMGAVSGIAMSASFAGGMFGLGEGMQKLLMVVSTLTGVMSAFSMIMMKNNATAAAGGAGSLFQRGAQKRDIGKQMIAGSGTAASRRGVGAGAARMAGGVGKLAMGALMSGPGLIAVAGVVAITAAVIAYKKEVNEAKKAMKEAFSVGTKTAQEYGYELTKVSDKIKENAKLTKDLGIGFTQAPTSTIVSEEKRVAISEDNENLIKDLKEKEKVANYIPSAQKEEDAENERRENQIKEQLLNKYATLRQQGVSVEDANEIVTTIAREAGNRTLSVLSNLRPQLEKMNSDNVNEVFKAAQEVQLNSLKNMQTGGTGGGEAFAEALLASVNVVQYAPPEDQLEALNNLITNMQNFNPDKVILAAEALKTLAAETYGTDSQIGGTLDKLFSETEENGNFKTDQKKRSDLVLGQRIMSAEQLGILTESQIKNIEILIDKGSESEARAILDEVEKNRNVLINIDIANKEQAKAAIEEIEKQITEQQALFDEQMTANDNAVDAENARYEKAQKAHEEFIKQKQDEIDAINKSADAYIKALQDEQRADDFAQQQRDTATGGLKALASGDVFGFVQSQQEMAGAAQQFGFESEIKAIDERRQAAVEAKEDEIKKQQELAALESETHKNNLKAIEEDRTALAIANADQMKSLLDQQDAFTTLGNMAGGAFEKMVGGYSTTAQEAGKVIAVEVALDAISQGKTMEEAIAAGQQYMSQTFGVQNSNGGEGSSAYTTTGTTSSPSSSGATTQNPTVTRNASGGYISGAGGPKADLIPARLSNGEYVVQASAVDQYGVGMMNAINEQKFADGGFVSPTRSGKKGGNPYGVKKSYYSLGYHTGQDYVADVGDDILAVAAGSIVGAGFSGPLGNLLTVQHADGIRTYYAHLSKILKRKGEVEKGEHIGEAGFSGNVIPNGPEGAHLHFEARKSPYKFERDLILNPNSYLSGASTAGGEQQGTETVSEGLSLKTLDRIATSMGTTAEVYSKVKNEGAVSLLGRKFGGSMTMNKPYMVGENGPEIVMPYGSGGKVVPIKYNVPKMASGGIMNGSMASSSPQINVTVNGVNDPKQAADRAAQLINSEMNRRKFSRSIG